MMEYKDILEYSEKYKKHQIRLSKGIMIFLLIVGIIFIGCGIFISIYNFNKYRIVVGIIMIVAGILNIPLGIKFKNISIANINKMKPEEAAVRYCKIYGIDKN